LIDSLKDKNGDLPDRLGRSLAVLFQAFQGADYILLTRLDSDDMLHENAIKEIQAKTLKKLRPRCAILMRNGFVYDKNSDQLAYWEPKTNPPFHTIVFPGGTFFDAWRHLRYYGSFKTHEDIVRVLPNKELGDGQYCVLTEHGHHISTTWKHPFNKPFKGDKKKTLKEFGL